jgi:hypothetical protein
VVIDRFDEPAAFGKRASECERLAERTAGGEGRREDPGAVRKCGRLYRKQINLGLGGDPRQALSARDLQQADPAGRGEEDDGSVWARFDLWPARGAADSGASCRGWWSG